MPSSRLVDTFACTARRGEEGVNLAWLAERLNEFVDLHPDFEVPIERLATWLARLDDPDDPDDD